MKTKIKLIYLLLTALIMHFSIAFGQSKPKAADKVTGVYWSPKKDAKIEIYKKGEQYYGKSIWVAVPKKDVENPEVSLRKRSTLGIELLTNFNFANGEYSGGSIYDPQSGKTYSCKMTLIGENLKVRGYIGISLFGRTEIFERIK
jgi:uncharacterized protein (DUF2147 family)